MSVLRNRPKGARFASFGLGLCVFALIPTEIGYQDIAALLARQPGVAERWQKRVFSSAVASIQVATFSFGRPIGTASRASATFQLASLDNQGIDITGSLTRNPIVQPPPRYQASDFPKVNRTLKGDRLANVTPENAIWGRTLQRLGITGQADDPVWEAELGFTPTVLAVFILGFAILTARMRLPMRASDGRAAAADGCSTASSGS